jgi:hypothetical protein
MLATRAFVVMVRTPFLDWDPLSYTRSMPASLNQSATLSKPLFKAMLRGWPGWFVHRRKLGSPYHLRWAFALQRGLGEIRDLVSEEAVARWRKRLPRTLQAPPKDWDQREILNYFQVVHRLAGWSRFARRLPAG